MLYTHIYPYKHNLSCIICWETLFIAPPTVRWKLRPCMRVSKLSRHFYFGTHLLSQVFISLSLQIAVSTLGALNENPLPSRTGKAARPRWTARVSRGCRLHPRCSRCPRDSPPDLPQRSLRILALRRRRPPPCRTARRRWPRSFWPRTTPEPARLKTAETRCTLRPRRPRDGGTAEAHSRPRLDNAG